MENIKIFAARGGKFGAPPGEGGVGGVPWGWGSWGWGPTKGVSIRMALASKEREYKERGYAERANGSAGMRGA